MQFRVTSVVLLVAALVVSASATRRHVHVQVLSAMSQTVHGVGVSPPSFDQLSTQVPCSQPYPKYALGVVQGNPGSVDRCIFGTSSHAVTGSVQNRRVEAILTTEAGQTYFVVLGCQRQFGWCAPLVNGSNYAGTLDDAEKWLARYKDRPVYGPMHLRLRPDGTHRVTYAIEYAAKVRLLRRR